MQGLPAGKQDRAENPEPFDLTRCTKRPLAAGLSMPQTWQTWVRGDHLQLWCHYYPRAVERVDTPANRASDPALLPISLPHLPLQLLGNSPHREGEDWPGTNNVSGREHP